MDFESLRFHRLSFPILRLDSQRIVLSLRDSYILSNLGFFLHKLASYNKKRWTVDGLEPSSSHLQTPMVTAAFCSTGIEPVRCFPKLSILFFCIMLQPFRLVVCLS